VRFAESLAERVTESVGPQEAAETAADWLAANWRLLRAAVCSVLPGPTLEGDADDAAQDAAVAIWLHWDDGYDRRLGTRASWAYAIAKRRAIDYLRRRRTRQHTAARVRFEASAAWRGGWDAVDVERLVGQRDDLQRTWPRLTPDERRAAALLAGGHTYASPAALLRWPAGTLKSRLHHMRQRLAAAPPLPPAPVGSQQHLPAA
jgi:RNA polymerase sigma factor (sigma-70 family)